LGELNVQASDGAEKSTKSVRLAMVQKRGEQRGRRGVEMKKMTEEGRGGLELGSWSIK
jgi:hypothetical protein